MNSGKVIWLWPICLLLIACRSQPAAISLPVSNNAITSPPAVTAQLPPTTSPAATLLPATNTAVPTPLPSNTAVPSPSATLPPAPTNTAAPTATLDPYAAYTIEALAARPYGSGELQLGERLENNDGFARYLISYLSDGLAIQGFMNVPHEGSQFPVAIVLHGYIDPARYETLAYTTRYADALAEAGYLVIHPNLRGFPPSDEASSEGDDAFRSGLAIDVLNLIATIRAQSADAEGPLRRANPDAIHLWGHSMGGGVVLRVVTVLNAPYVRAAALYGAMSGDEALNYEQILIWSGGRSGAFELSAAPEALQAISPIYHLERIRTPISIHHGDADATVPPAWSADLCARLKTIDHPVECFTYNAAPHTFYGAWEELFNERVITFFGSN